MRELETTTLTIDQSLIVWQQRIDAFHWYPTNLLPIHHCVSINYFKLGYASKMRNYQAEQVLNTDMLVGLQTEGQNIVFEKRTSLFFSAASAFPIKIHKCSQQMYNAVT